MKHLGILGVGHLASYLVPGWARAKERPSFLLSPRNAAVAARLERDYGCHIAADNAALVRESDVVVLATRPGHAVAAARGLPWRAEQTVVSVVAGLEIDGLHGVREFELLERDRRLVPVGSGGRMQVDHGAFSDR